MELRNQEINNSQISNEIEPKNLTNSQETAEIETAVSLDCEEEIEEKLFTKEIFSKSFTTVLIIFGISLAVYLISRFVPAFAEFWTRYPAQAIRFVLAKLTGWIPFSFAEAVLISLPFLAISYIICSSISTKKDNSNQNFYRWFRPIVSFLLVIVIIFFVGFGPAYSRNKLAENLGIEQKNVSADELYDTSKIIAQLAEENLSEIKFDITGASVLPYDYKTLTIKVNEAFEKYAESVDYISHFKSNPKAISLSEPMTYTHISGVYTFMTGEANININYPDFLIPFTMAHEMAHQRGIAREDEANFVAFLVCINSDDAYLRYSGYANMENYLMSALSKASIDKYKEFSSNHLPKELYYEFVSYSTFFDKYRESVASEVTGTVNNAFLQSQGQQAGTKSYGLVVDLAVAYYK